MAERRPTLHRTNHWAGIAGAALLVVAIGIVARRPPLVLAGVVAVSYAGLSWGARSPRVRASGADGDGGDLSVRRALSDTSPDPGEAVTVTVTVRNASGRYLPDVRLVDGVPEGLAVADGSPRLATPLRPGAGATVSYEVTAVRGEHVWDDVQVVASDATGSLEYRTTASAETTLTCTPSLLAADALPLRSRTSLNAGRVATDEGGAGIEFYGVRDYRRGDPLSRVDWNSYARTGELATLNFRQERSATVVLVVDTRKQAYLARDDRSPHAVEYAVDAVRRAFATLLSTGNRAGIVAVGREECWLEPGAGDRHRARARELLASHPAFSATPPDSARYGSYLDERRDHLRRREIREFHERFPPDAQVILVGPCCDGYVPTAARRLTAMGRAVTVISPDVTVDDTPEHGLARRLRRDRLSELRRRGIRVLDWDVDEPFDAALERARTRRRREP